MEKSHNRLVSRLHQPIFKSKKFGRFKFMTVKCRLLTGKPRQGELIFALLQRPSESGNHFVI